MIKSCSKWFYLAILLLVACSNSVEQEESESNASATYNDEEVTLTMMLPVDEDTFDLRFKQQIEAHFPNLTLELAQEAVTSETLQELIARNEIPDLIWAPGEFTLLEELDLLESLDPYIEVASFDLNVFQEGLVELTRSLIREVRMCCMACL